MTRPEHVHKQILHTLNANSLVKNKEGVIVLQVYPNSPSNQAAQADPYYPVGKKRSESNQDKHYHAFLIELHKNEQAKNIFKDTLDMLYSFSSFVPHG